LIAFAIDLLEAGDRGRQSDRLDSRLALAGDELVGGGVRRYETVVGVAVGTDRADRPGRS
jgi:hypothetical protein